jgi:uncharacterized protein
MKSVFRALLLSISLIFSSGMTSYAQDFEKGLRAAQSGDFATALREWMPLAERGDADAQYNVAQMYSKGDGVIQDDRQAVKWWLKAAKQNHTSAQYNIGVMYAEGRGIIQDYKEALKMFSKAAEKGDADAQSYLGAMYVKGHAVLQDDVYAHMWWNIAASNGNEIAAKNRSIVTKRMTSSQIAEAQKLARECVAKEYKGC